MIDKLQALEIIDKRDFFNDRAGRELWNEKPKEIQDEDIRNAHEEYEQLKEYVLNQPKVGEWISVEERLPEDNQAVLTCKNKQISIFIWKAEKRIWLEPKGNWWWSYCTVEKWLPLPEPFKGD